MPALDGQSFYSQGDDVIASFIGMYGEADAQREWEKAHNQELLSQGKISQAQYDAYANPQMYGNAPGSYDHWPTYLRDPKDPAKFGPQYGGAPIPEGPASKYGNSVAKASEASGGPKKEDEPEPMHRSPWADQNPSAIQAAKEGKTRKDSKGAAQGWVYDLVQKNGRWVAVRRHHVLTYNKNTKVVENEEVPSWDDSPEAQKARNDTGGSKTFGDPWAKPTMLPNYK